MVQALQTEDGSLPQGLTVQNMYMELRWGSKKAVMVVRNSMAYSQVLQKKTPVAMAVAALLVPEPSMEVQLQKEGDEPKGPHTPRLTVRQRHGKLFDELDLSGLDSWSPELADAVHWLLAKYHNVFPLDPTELGCTHSMEHTIKVMDDTPFKEWFRWIPPPLVEEVWNHLWEMLESGTIQPSQSAWCNVVVLVRKDGGLWFCIDFCLPECSYKKGLLPPAQNTGGIGEFGRCWAFFLLGPQIRVLADKDGGGIKAVHCLHSRLIWGFLNAITCPLGSVMCQWHFNSLCRIAWAS